MYEETATGHFRFFNGIGNGHLVLGNEPHVAVDASVVGEVERHLLLARGVGLVVAVIGLDGDDQVIARSIAKGGKVEGDGQIAALVLHGLLAVDIDGLLAHDGLEVQGDVTPLALLWQAEVLAIPGDALIVAAAAGLGRHQLDGMRGADHFP